MDTEEAIHDFMKERSIVIPKLQEARKSEQTWKSTIEEQRHEYSEARDRCSQEEEVIKDLDQKVDDLKEKSEMSFGKVILQLSRESAYIDFIILILISLVSNLLCMYPMLYALHLFASLSWIVLLPHQCETR